MWVYVSIRVSIFAARTFTSWFCTCSCYHCRHIGPIHYQTLRIRHLFLPILTATSSYITSWVGTPAAIFFYYLSSRRLLSNWTEVLYTKRKSYITDVYYVTRQYICFKTDTGIQFILWLLVCVSWQGAFRCAKMYGGKKCILHFGQEYFKPLGILDNIKFFRNKG